MTETILSKRRRELKDNLRQRALQRFKKETESIRRKLSRLKKEKDPENIDSHIKSIAGSLHCIYSGYEKDIRAFKEFLTSRPES